MIPVRQGLRPGTPVRRGPHRVRARHSPALARILTALACSAIAAAASAASPDPASGQGPEVGISLRSPVDVSASDWGDVFPATGIEQIVMSSSGDVIVRDRRLPALLRLAPNGDFLGLIGGSGEGPGEFVRVNQIGFWGDSLWAVDWRADRVSLFSASGAFLRSQAALGAVPILAPLRSPVPVAYAGNGTVLLVAAIGEEMPADRYAVLDRRASGALETWRVLDAESRSLLIAKDAGRFMMDQPYSFSDVFGLVGDRGARVVVQRPLPAGTDAGTYYVSRTADGVTTVVAVDYTPVPLVRDAALAPLEESLAALRERPGGASLEEDVREAVLVPPVLPPIPNLGRGLVESSILGGWDGEIWIRRLLDPHPAAPQVWDVIGDDRLAVKGVQVPPGVSLLAVGEVLAWGVRTGPFDAPVLVRMAVERNDSR